MSRIPRALHFAIALFGMVSASSTAAAQRALPATGQTAPPERRNWRSARRVIYVPIPLYYGYVAQPSRVTDVDGRPLGEAFEMQASREEASSFPVYTPDLSGSPYVVIDGGAMVVDFGDGLRRTFASCAALSAESTPDGQPRTLFYRPPAGIVFRAGRTGRVRGAPPAGANACYANDAYGRTELRY